MDTAIVGIAFRFPGANGCDAFWDNLVERRSSVREIPPERWDWRPLWGDPKLDVNKTHSRWAGLIDDVDAFDHEFFGLLPKVVHNMDPQQRIMLELAWASLEDAGIPPSSLRGRRVGVFAGVTHHDYKELLARARVPIEPYHYTGTATVVVPNRVSHAFGLRGPSLPVDTACSSSLNAIHLAIQSFENGECEMALAGGISLILNPARHISVSKMGTLSPTGSCKTLDDRADGYVRGEGAGFFVLKPLEKALADRDLIYGVIKGSAVNHCGKTHTLSYPSPDAQADVIVDAHRRSGVPISSVNFVELHGTGTAKGDPIEFEGLRQAFARLSEEQGVALEDAYCGLSSAKTNLGHLEAAAGMAAVAKVLLAFRHRRLPGFHDFRTLNSRVTIEGTPFYILDQTRPWSRRGERTPLRAGVSSFGFGGTNAHLVLEEPPPPPSAKRARHVAPSPQLIALSAKTPGALRRRRDDLVAWLRADAGEHTLDEIARTLLLERDHLPLRFACVVDDVESLIAALSEDASDDSGKRPASDAASSDAASEERKSALDAEAAAWLVRLPKLKKDKRRTALEALLALYRDGAEIAWSTLYSEPPTRRVRLPVYAFERHRFWLPQTDAVDDSGQRRRNDDQPHFHPLLHRNAPSVDLQRFLSVFDGSECFLADHRVRGQRMLPGVAYLEMVRAAIAQMVGLSSSETHAIRIADVVWLRPLTVGDERAAVEVELTPIDVDGRAQRRDFEFRVSVQKRDAAAQALCRGLVSLDADALEPTPSLSALEAGVNESWRSADAIYADFAEQGLDYGPAHRIVRDLRVAPNYGLADIELPPALREEANDYILHPGIADAALQAAVAFLSAAGGEFYVRAAIPFAVDDVLIECAPVGPAYAYVRRSPGADDKLDIDVLDGVDGGRRCAAFRGLSVRPLVPVVSSLAPAAAKPASDAADTIAVPASLNETLYATEWRAQPASPVEPPTRPAIPQIALIGPRHELDWAEGLLRAAPRFADTRFERIVLLAEGERIEDAGDGVVAVRPGVLEDYHAAVAALASRGASLQRTLLVASHTQHNRYAERIAASAQHAFALAKAMFRGTKTARLLYLTPPFEDDVEHLALSALFKTLRIEKPSYSGRVLDGAVANGHHGALADIVADEFLCSATVEDVRYRDGVREVRGYAALGARVERPQDPDVAEFREGGTYLITGGLGGLGRIVARHLCARYRANVYLTGRSAPGDAQNALLAELRAHGGNVAYLVCDVADRDDVRRAMAAVHADGHRLNGVLHSAGVIEDAFVLRKSAEEFARVIAPKTLGTWYLDEATRDEPLDMFVLFSSVAGALGNVGQCDYAYGNAFEDAFAHLRETLRLRDERSGKSLSINWPFWRNGGMKLGDAEIEAVRRSFGIVPLLDAPGLDALEFGLAQGRPQMLVMPGDAVRVREVLGAPAAPSAAASDARDSGTLDADAVFDSLARMFSEQLRIAESFAPDRSFKDYGFDSVVMIELIALLEKRFGALPKTLFFEYPNLGALTGYFVEQHAATCRDLIGVSAPDAAAGAAPAAAIDAEAVAEYLSARFAEQLRIDPHFDLDKSFKDYGFDSVVMIELIALLERIFGTLPKTLFFEYPNLGALTGYFLAEHAKTFARLFGAATQTTGADAAADAAAEKALVPPSRAAAFAARRAAVAPVEDDAIAIVGIAGRYPQADTLEAFWENLRIGRDCVETIPSERHDLAAKFRFRPGEAAPGHSYAQWGGFLRDVDRFDAAFFNISPKEAESIDPNERLFLEVAAHAIEDAGYTPDTLARPRGERESPVGVYVGVMWGDYQLHGVDRAQDAWATPHSFYWSIANRVSYQFNFSGPSLALDTACSSSLTAIHLACQAIRQGEIDAAIAGASNLSLHPNKYNLLSDLHFLSQDGRCRAFGEGGTGYVPGEGVGAVVLKSLSKARRDGDHIYGVIRASAVNHGGKAAGFTVPNPNRQAALIRDALQAADVDPRRIDYVEAHGTGTGLGDPIEIKALTAAYDQRDRQYCAIGSVKSNIGHLEAASGIAGLTKVLLQLKHRMLAPSIHSDTPNPLIDFAASPFRLQHRLEPWRQPTIERDGARVESPRLAGLSSFGAGGANAHLVIEEYVETPRANGRDGGQRHGHDHGPMAIVLSARSETALRAIAARLREHLRANPEIDAHDAAYTLQVGRVAMEWRAAFVVSDRDALLERLRAFAERDANDALGPNVWTGHRDAGRRDPAIAARAKAAAAQVPEWLVREDLPALVAAWVNGVEIDWRRLPASGRRRRVSLPGYPYQRQRHWIPDAPAVGAGAAALHPLIDANVSTLDEQAFAKTFRGDEFVLRDHRLGEHRILPGAAMLEMAVQAAHLAAPGRRVAELRDVQWRKAIVVDADPMPIRIALSPERDAVRFDLYADDAVRALHAQGAIAFAPETADDAPRADDAETHVDIAAVRARCRSEERDGIDAAFAAMGFAFGESFRVFERLHWNDEEALAELRLPPVAGLSHDAFALPPALLDGALRTTLGIGGLAATTALRVPVRLERLAVFGALGERAVAYARRASRTVDADQTAYDVEVCDLDGRVRVRLRGLVAQAAPQFARAAMSSAPSTPKPLAAPSPGRRASEAPTEAPTQAIAVALLRRMVSDVTKLAADQIDPNAPLENYGIDSVMIASLNRGLEARFGEIPKTLFFEHQEIAGVAGYFADEHAATLRAMASEFPSVGAAHASAADVERTSDAADDSALARLYARLRDVAGEEAAHCAIDTPLATWPLDPLAVARLLHALGEEFENVDPFAPYRHATLADWAAELRRKPGAASSVPAPERAAALVPTARARGGHRFLAAREDEDIAIVGLSGHYPGADDLHTFWGNLAAGRDGIVEIPLSRWDHARYFHPDRRHKGTVYSKWGGFIDGVDLFDARFFNMTAREAEITDPQERLFLQTAWECFEDACYTRQSLKGRSVGVFVGVMWANYAQIDVSDEQLNYGRPSTPFASIANRVSYAMNLDGPSLALDTMCSSSLTAIHTACRAIADGDCGMALAGGVNLILHPHKYQQLASSQFLSTDGRCRAFGDGGDGYVPGEGVGAVLLKRLSEAVADGDHIYGVIKATALNHGGKTNGYTVPNQVAQTAVIGKALKRSGWDPRTIDYIEAHGTGTSLGDPIEIAGLSRAFSQALAETVGDDARLEPQRCRIGSIKSNFGHLESAAAIAGLTKLLMQFRYGAIAPSLHSATLNPNIDFARSPFRVVQREESWPADAARGPRRAGLSSFGAGGSNAHCLIEDYPRPRSTAVRGRPALFVLSADGEPRLTRYVDRVVAFLERGGDPDVGLDLADLAYASQIGREPMAERLAVVANDVDDLLSALRAWREGRSDGRVVRGRLQDKREGLDGIVDEREKDALIRGLIETGRLPQLARAWASMLDVEWAKFVDALYPASAYPRRPRRMPFPTLPFLGERHWVEERAERVGVVDAPHPLIDRNLSTWSTLAYGKRFDGREFYLRDHIVRSDRERMLLPGAAYLEMARAAGELAVAGDGLRVESVRNLMWMQPFEIGDGPDGLTTRMTSDESALRFEIARDSDGGVCVEGELRLADADAAPMDEALDLAALLARGELIDADQDAIYAGFRNMGFLFGPAFRITRERYRLSEGALCRLRLPDALRAGLDAYGLHPTLLDAVLRSALAVDAGEGGLPSVPIVPFALDALEYRHPLAEECYVYVTRRRDAMADSGVGLSVPPGANATIYKYDLLVADRDGRVLIKLFGFTGRSLMKQPSEARARVMQYFGYQWRPAPLPTRVEDAAAHVVLFATTSIALAEAFAQRMSARDRVVPALIADVGDDARDATAAANGIERFDPFDADSAARLFAALRARGLTPDRIVYCDDGEDGDAIDADAVRDAALHRGIQAVRHLFVASERDAPGSAVRLLYAFRDDGRAQPQHDAVAGYARSLLTLNHRFELSTLRDDRAQVDARAAAIADELALSSGFGGNEIAYRDGARHRRSLCRLDAASPSNDTLPLREGGCYLITGGAGKLGLAVARHLAQRTRACLLLSGRSSTPSPNLERELDALRALGARVLYRSADSADADAVRALVDVAKTEFGAVHGVIHCAGVARDRSILELDDREFAEMLAPKAEGLALLDRATADQPLDFFVCFSSVSALLGDLGAGAYAVANRFMDSYARWREAQRAQGRRNGRSISINWPLWATGGMEIAGSDASVFGFSGMQAISEAEGLEAFDRILCGQENRVLVSIGDPQRVARALRLQDAAVEPAALEPAARELVPLQPVALKPAEPAPARPMPMVSPSTAPASASTALPPPTLVSPTASPDAMSRAETYVKARMAAVAKTRAEAIDARASFEQCGLDSVLLLELHAALKADFDALPKTALFEFDSAERMARFLMTEYAPQAQRMFADASDAAPAAAPAATPAAPMPSLSVTLPSTPSPSVSTPTHTLSRLRGAALPSRRGAGPVRAAAPAVDEGIAIVGIAGEFPDSPDVECYWRNVREGRDCTGRVPPERGFASALNRYRSRSGKAIADAGGFIADVDLFDPALFRMSRAEADRLDPQLRVLLRTAWRAIEDAAYTPQTLAERRVGVFVGAMNEDFTWIASELQARSGAYLGPGAMSSELSNRLSYLMNLHGPSLTLSTACASSLTAVHLARRAILAGDCEAALVGGVNLSLHASKYHLLQDMKVLSPDGHERTFDDAANGLVPSEGAGVVLLKRLGRAIEDGDHIYGVLRGSRISHSGVGAGQFMPNIRVLEDTAAECIAEAGVAVEDLTYIESHGTGTELGDPIELKALANALRRSTAATGFCAIGSKANLGHMEAASGLGSLIKVLLSMRHGEIAPCAKLRRINGSFDADASPFVFPRAAAPWPKNAHGTRIAGVHSFGMGGSNAFVVVESYDAAPSTNAAAPREPVAFALSARTADGLRGYAAGVAAFVRAHRDDAESAARFADWAYVTQIGRALWRHRLAVVARDADELCAALDAWSQAPDAAHAGVYAGDIESSSAQDTVRLLAGESGERFFAALLETRDLRTLAELWSRGAAIDWSALHRAQPRRRTAFPGAPFESVRCDLRHLLDAADAAETVREGALEATSLDANANDAASVLTPIDLPIDLPAGGWYRLDAIESVAADERDVADAGDDGVRDYWATRFGSATDTASELAVALPPETASDDASDAQESLQCVSELVDTELLRTLQTFGRQHGIAIETLVAAAWAVLMNRHTKARCSQFGVFGAGNSTISPTLVPVRVRTVGRQKMLQWLQELQADLLRQHREALAPIERIREWAGQEPLFDTLVAFDRRISVGDDEAADETARTQASWPRPRFELVTSASEDSLELTLLYRARTPNYAQAGVLLEQFVVLLEGIVSNPDKMPSALGMRTRAESRERFWKTMEATTD